MQTRRRITVSLISMISLMVGWMLLSPHAALAEKFKLRLQCAYPQNANVGQTTEFFAQRLEELTGGNVTVKISGPTSWSKPTKPSTP